MQLLRQFKDVTVLALLAAAIVAALMASFEDATTDPLMRYRDSIAIAVIVVLNALIGLLQERKAERSLNALRKLAPQTARVVRDGQETTIVAERLVPGDTVALRQGDRVPADLRLSLAFDLEVAEATLTGESLPVKKDSVQALTPEPPLAERRNMAFTGTHVTRGHGRGLVVATGERTELGAIAGMLQTVKSPDTPLQRRLRRFGVAVVVGCVALGIVVFAVLWWQGLATPRFVVLTAVSLAVAVIPEGLPAITTIVLALGVQRMARKKALIRRLAAVETLGTAQIICTDKTGTITQNRMQVRKLWVADKVLDVGSDGTTLRLTDAGGNVVPPDAQLKRLLSACVHAPALEDPTDRALRDLYGSAKKAMDLGRHEPAAHVLPFDPNRRLATVLVRDGDSWLSYTHGAPEAVLACVHGDPEQAGAETVERALAAVDELTTLGLRVLALAGRRLPADVRVDQRPEDLAGRVEHELTLFGLVGLADPPRPEARAALERARRAGLRTIVITGDHPRTAQAIAQELGLLADGGEVVAGSELEGILHASAGGRAARVAVVARATAADKLALVSALTEQGNVVAMTGDGVNDAPAIKAASIGVAMGREATDVTREAADMVIQDGDYSTIVAAIEEGRVIYGNIKRFIVFLFAANAGLVVAVFASALLGWPPLLTPTQILWINLITNGLPALALGMEPVHGDPMQSGPRRPDEPLLLPRELAAIAGYGLVMGLAGLWVFGRYFAGPSSLPLARTMAFTVLALAPLFHALSARSTTESLWSLGPLTNLRLVGAFGVALSLQGLAVYLTPAHRVFETVPLGPRELLTALSAAAAIFFVGEIFKKLRRFLAAARKTTSAFEQGGPA
jgi:Ca2+-transporting ATPase